MSEQLNYSDINTFLCLFSRQCKITFTFREYDINMDGFTTTQYFLQVFFKSPESKLLLPTPCAEKKMFSKGYTATGRQLETPHAVQPKYSIG